MDSIIPGPLLSFLSSYPQPAFALSATPLRDALISRRVVGSRAPHQEAEAAASASLTVPKAVSESDHVRTKFNSGSSRKSKSTLKTDQAQASSSIPFSSPSSAGEQPLIPDLGTQNSTESDQTAGGTPSATPADRVLANAFASPAGPLKISSPTHSSLLEGGDQISHHPSRTAEGAVAAMYEQRKAREDDAEREELREKEDGDKRNEERKSRNADTWGSVRRTVGSNVGKESVGRSLTELLRPVWSNQRWKDLTRGTDEDLEVGILALLDRNDAQKLLGLLIDAMKASEAEGPIEEGASTLQLRLKFPVESVHYRSLAARSTASPPFLSSMSPDDKSTAGRTTSGITVTDSAEPTLNLVATFLPSHDSIIITTVASSSTSRPSSLKAERAPSASTSHTSTSAQSGSGSPPIIGSLSQQVSDEISPLYSSVKRGTSPTRPHQSRHSSSFSSVSTTSSIATAHGNETPRSVSDPVFLATTRPRARDLTPAPAPQYTGVPLGIKLTMAPNEKPYNFPSGFVLERRSRKNSKRDSKRQASLAGIGEPGAHGEQELTPEEERAEGSAAQLRRRKPEIVVENLEEQSSDSSRGSTGDEESGRDSEQGLAKVHIGRRDYSGPPEFKSLDLLPKGASAPQGYFTIAPNTISPSPPITEQSLSLLQPQLPPPSPLLLSSIFPPSTDPFLLNLEHTPMGRLIRAFPWETSPLGPILSWPRELRVMVTLLLATPFKRSIWYGEENVLIYNDAYAAFAGNKHPEILGKAGAEGWSEIWDELGPLAAKVMQGETVSFYDHQLAMFRSGYLEETYHIWSFIPFRGVHGEVLGYDNPNFETTPRVIAERRLATIRDLVAFTSSARTVKDYCQKTLQAIATNEYDIPFTLLYTCEVIPAGLSSKKLPGPETARSHDATAREQTKLTSIATYRLHLEGTIAVPEGHSSAPTECFISIDHAPPGSRDSDASSNTSATATNTTATTSNASASIWPFAEACSRRKPVFIADLGNRTKGFEARGWPDDPRHALCIPILFEDDASATPRAILVVGLNPRRPWNEVFATFFHLLARQIGTGLFSVHVSANDSKRAQEMIVLDRAKTNFFSNVSHELRTPLTLILGPLEDVLSSKSNLEEVDRSRLVTVQRHANRLLNMVNTLLDFSRLEGGRSEVTYRPTRLAAVTADLGSLFRAAIERGKIDYIVDCEEDPTDGRPIYLAVDLWEKVIFNLVGNAYKYTLNGTITLRVRFNAKEAVVCVIDTGCGIAEQELGHIFERFHRVESSSRARDGTGIGLALTLELVRALGGMLEVKSELGKGSTFTVRLPRGSTHLPASQVGLETAESVALPPRAQYNLAIIEEAASWRIQEGGTTKEPTPQSASSVSASSASGEDTFLVTDLLNLKSSTVLLVDDNEDLRVYIAGTLSKSFTVVQASDGQAALEYALRKPPSLVVSDVMMPNLDGRGLLAALRANPSTALIPVIFLSAEAGSEARVEALLQGADDYLVKPFQSRELLARVNVHLQLGKMRTELEKRVEERTRALIESEMRYRGLADRYSTLSVLSPVGVHLVDIDGNMTYANPRWYEISGHPPNKPLSEWRDSVLPEDLSKAEQVWTEAVQGGSLPKNSWHAEFRWRGGNWVQFEIRAFHESGSKRGFVGAVTDISRQKKIEALHIQTVDQRAADAEENRRQMELFIDMASHELRNPLSGVWQNAEVVQTSLEHITDVIDEFADGNPPDAETLEELRREMQENTEAVESIILCASHQGRIADDILNVSKLNMGLLSINLVPFNLASKMGEVLRMFEVECQQKQIALRLAQNPSLTELRAEWIIADPSRLAQILINFLTNSVKYTSDAQERKITIHLDAFIGPPPRSERTMRVAEPASLEIPEDKVWIVVGVEDSGKGLNRDELKKLFARFSQANPKSDQYGGSGLGLYVSRALVELHQGFIEVESVRGEGSTFRFAIPASRAQTPPEGTPPLTTPGMPIMRSARKGSALSAFISPPLAGAIGKGPNGTAAVKTASLHVLVVEDNLINQKVMQRQLKMEKFTVTVANNGQEALDILLSDQKSNGAPDSPPRIDIVLMDIEMPIMDGLTAIRKLRELEKTDEVSRHYNVIAVTGNARQGQIDECLSSGFDDVAIKPYVMRDLLVQMKRLVNAGVTSQTAGSS